MPLSKYVDLLLKKKLALCRLDVLEDQWEGRIPEIARMRNNLLSDMPELAEQGDKELEEEMRFSLYVCCFFSRGIESAAMWDLYGSNDVTIALRTRKEYIEEKIESKHTSIEKVVYSDHDEENLPSGWTPQTLKKECFDHEREVRLIHYDRVEGCPATKFGDRVKYFPLNSELDLSTFIEQVLVSPRSQSWHLELIKDLNKEFGLDVQVEASSLYRYKR